MANGACDSQLFSLTNQDRTSNGVRSLSFSGTLQNIGEGAPYNCRGVQVYGRSVDMIRRNYFAHPILGCGEYVFSMMQAFGIHYRSAGENIGWVAYVFEPRPSYINGEFMASPDHRVQHPLCNYTEMGVGSDESAPGVTWTGLGSEQDVWMFSEEFAQVGLVIAATPTRQAAAPKPVKRNSPAPAPPAARCESTTTAARTVDNADTHATADPGREPSREHLGPAGRPVRGACSQHDRIRPRSFLDSKRASTLTQLSAVETPLRTSMAASSSPRVSARGTG